MMKDVGLMLQGSTYVPISEFRPRDQAEPHRNLILGEPKSDLRQTTI